MNESDVSWSFDKGIYEYCKTNILVNFECENIIHLSIGRNALLHEHGTKSNSLKLILFFNQIVPELVKLDV